MSVFEKLEAEKAALTERLAEIESLLDDYRMWESRVSAVIGSNRDVSDSVSHSAHDSAERRLARAVPQMPMVQPSSMEEFEDAVKEVLGTSPIPLDRTKLLGELRQIGVRVGGAEEKNTLSARMSRLPYITNIKGQGYMLSSREDEFIDGRSEEASNDNPTPERHQDSIFG